jgi:hypothetical protein
MKSFGDPSHITKEKLKLEGLKEINHNSSTYYA